MVDLHCHVLPGVDDGPATLEDTLALCRVAHEDGTRTLVATPHLNAEYPGLTGDAIHAQVAMVNQALHAEKIDVAVRPGAEVALSRIGELSDAEVEALALGGGRYVLVELPWTSAASGAAGAIAAFAGRGYGIMVAHPERAPMVQRDTALVRGLVDSGVLCCLDASSLAGQDGRRTETVAWELLEAGLAHAIASDCHDAVRRPPRLASVLEHAGLTQPQIDYFIRQTPEAIINGEAVAPPPMVEDRRRRRWLPLRRR